MNFIFQALCGNEQVKTLNCEMQKFKEFIEPKPTALTIARQVNVKLYICSNKIVLSISQ